MINFNLVSNCTISLFTQRIVPLLTDRQKKIVAIAAAALGALALCYILISHCCMKTLYKAEYKNDILIKKTYPNGIIEEGEFEGGKLHGQGKKTYPNEFVEEGEFENGDFKKGKITRIEGMVFEGEIINGFPKGKLTQPDGTVDFGSFKDKLFYRKRTLPNGRVEEGEFENAELIKGKIRYTDGTVDEGEFHDGFLKDGQVKITLPDETVYEGLLTENLKIKGKITRPDKTVEEGVFLIVGTEGERTILQVVEVF